MDLEIDFRKLVCDDNDNGFELAYANKVTIDGKRSPRGNGFMYESKQSEAWVLWSELGRI